jgi:DNA modification methylase
MTGAGPTRHLVTEGNARDLSFIQTESVHLVVTSPPYVMFKERLEFAEPPVSRATGLCLVAS